MKKKSLQLGFIGGGINSAVGQTHRIACQIDNKWDLKAGCFSRNSNINMQTAELWGVHKSRVYPDWKTFLLSEKGRLDAVCILTPTNKHYEMLLMALDLGYAIICEKSLTNSVQEARIICEKVEMNNSFVAVTYNYTGYPMIRELKGLIENDRFGSIHFIHIEMPQEGYSRLDHRGNKPNPQPWRLVDESIPTISLDLGIHLQNMILFLTGEKPVEVVADQFSNGFFGDIVDNVTCLARYTANIRAQFWYTKSALGHRNGLRIRIFGEKGGAEWYQMNPEVLILNDQFGCQTTIDRASNVSIANQDRYNRFKSGHPAGFIEAFGHYYYDVAECLNAFNEKRDFQNPYIFDCRTAKEGLKMMEAIATSAKTDQWIKLASI